MRCVLLTVPVLIGLLLAGCGGDIPAPEGRELGEDGATVTVDGEPALACSSGVPFPPSVLPDGDPELNADDHLADDVAEALQAFAAEADMETPAALAGVDVEDAEWTILAKGRVHGTTEVEVALGTWTADGPTGDDAERITVRADRDDWRVGAGGTCNLELVSADGVIWAEVVALAEEADPEATELIVELSERVCTSGRDPTPHLRNPEIDYDEDAVTVRWASDEPEGDEQTCEGNPTVTQPLQLDEPLGDRELRDGSVWPPATVTGTSADEADPSGS